VIRWFVRSGHKPFSPKERSTSASATSAEDPKKCKSTLGTISPPIVMRIRNTRWNFELMERGWRDSALQTDLLLKGRAQCAIDICPSTPRSRDRQGS
jgi:hypothetical protein